MSRRRSLNSCVILESDTLRNVVITEISITCQFLSAIAARGSVSEVYQRFLPLISSDTVTEKISLWSRLPLANGVS